MTELSGENEVRIRLTFAEPLDCVTATLLIVFAVIFVGQELIPPFNKFVLTYLAMDTSQFLHKLYLWQAVTSIFLHGSRCHFLVNMICFWFFGTQLSNAWKHKEFLIYFFLCGIFASLCFYVFNIVRVPPNVQGIKGLGASGAVFGLMLAYAFVYGDRTVLAFLIIPMKAKYFVAILFVLEIMSVIAGRMDGVGHIAHVGGAVGGALYLKFIWRQQRGLAGFSGRKGHASSRVGGLEIMDEADE